MTAPAFYDFRSVLEQKLTDYVQGLLPDENVHKGVTDEVRTIPLIIVSCESERSPDAFGANNFGNYQVVVKIYVYSSADDGEDAFDKHRARVINVMGVLRDEEALKALFTPEEGRLYAMWYVNGENGISQRRYGNIMEYTAMGCNPPEPTP